MPTHVGVPARPWAIVNTTVLALPLFEDEPFVSVYADILAHSRSVAPVLTLKTCRPVPLASLSNLVPLCFIKSPVAPLVTDRVLSVSENVFVVIVCPKSFKSSSSLPVSSGMVMVLLASMAEPAKI